MIYLVPAPSTTGSNIEAVVSLDGTDYTIRLLWNERASRWFMTIRDADGSDLVTGFKVVADVPFAVHMLPDGLYPGLLWVLDTTGAGEDPGLRDFGSRVVLMYADEDSVS